jgi:methylenetetrahydrofolate--tRNA-(uracil-5-)-methyltransferase
MRSLAPLPFPADTVLGSLLHYLAHAASADFGPTNAMLGLLPPLPEGLLDLRGLKRAGGTRAVKSAKGRAHRERALQSLEEHLRLAGGLP